MLKPKMLFAFALMIVVLALVSGCTDKYDYPAETDVAQQSSCIKCHTDAETLKLVADADDGSGGDDSGEG